MMQKIMVLRSYESKNGERRTLDSGFINTMAVIISQSAFNNIEFDARNGWFVFFKGNRLIFRQLRPTRYLSHYKQDVCVVDRDFARILDVKDGDFVNFRPVGEKEILKFWVWIRSMTPTIRIAYWFMIIGVGVSSLLGGLLSRVF